MQPGLYNSGMNTIQHHLNRYIKKYNAMILGERHEYLESACVHVHITWGITELGTMFICAKGNDGFYTILEKMESWLPAWIEVEREVNKEIIPDFFAWLYVNFTITRDKDDYTICIQKTPYEPYYN